MIVADVCVGLFMVGCGLRFVALFALRLIVRRPNVSILTGIPVPSSGLASTEFQTGTGCKRLSGLGSVVSSSRIPVESRLHTPLSFYAPPLTSSKLLELLELLELAVGKPLQHKASTRVPNLPAAGTIGTRTGTGTGHDTSTPCAPVLRPAAWALRPCGRPTDIPRGSNHHLAAASTTALSIPRGSAAMPVVQ